jgi:uncharacterized protein (TIGR02145 family)
MKTLILSTILAWVLQTAGAQVYQLTFAGSGAATSVDSVKVENLSQCTTVMVGGHDTLVLFVETGIPGYGTTGDPGISVVPNPSGGRYSMTIRSSESGEATIRLYDATGRILFGKEERLEKGVNRFTLSGVPSGNFILETNTGSERHAAKLVSFGAGDGKPELSGNAPDPGTGFSAWQLKDSRFSGTRRLILTMQYNPGDTLKLTGRSGIYKNVKMLIATASQAVTFDFADCTDADTNHYATVQIGTQLWMQENLKTTHYLDGSPIPNVPDSATWCTTTDGAYCNFHNLPEEGEKYGRLYNYYAVDDPRKICPAGWHVPSTYEWNILEKYLDPTTDTTALMGTGEVIGRILKEGCDTRWAYWDTTCGFNSAGFTALCANFRNATGAWSLAPDNNHDTSFWTSTHYNSTMAWFRSFRWCYADIYQLFAYKRGGDSVRCVKDN